jgi:four helix bundle protein
MHPFTRLRTWTAAHELSIAIYKATERFPDQERYGMVPQLRRATCSIEANIAEGAGRRTQREFRRFLEIASSSASEVHCHLLLARDVGLIPDVQATRLVEQTIIVRRMLGALLRRVDGG